MNKCINEKEHQSLVDQSNRDMATLEHTRQEELPNKITLLLKQAIVFVDESDTRPQAIKIFEFLAKKYNSEKANNNLGLLYYHGLGVQEDKEKAYTYFKTALENGCEQAYTNLGICYFYGHGVEANMVTARTYLQQGSEKAPSADAFYLLALINIIQRQDIAREQKSLLIRSLQISFPETNCTCSDEGMLITHLKASYIIEALSEFAQLTNISKKERSAAISLRDIFQLQSFLLGGNEFSSSPASDHTALFAIAAANTELGMETRKQLAIQAGILNPAPLN